MKIFSEDYKNYIRNMDEKDLVIIDPPWSYNNKIMRDTQLSYSLWDNDEGLKLIFNELKA
jgi:site-specific DNA-adenine methylase